MCFAEKHERTLGLDHLIEAAQGLGPVQPVEGTPHGNESKAAKVQTKVVGASLTETYVRRQSLRCRDRRRNHLRLWIKSDDLPGKIPESDRKIAGAAAEVEHSMLLVERRCLGDPAN